MNIGILTILLFATFVICLVAGIPVAFALGGVAFLYAIILWGPDSLMLGAYGAYSAMIEFVLVAIPLFIMMGHILEKSGVAESLFRTLHLWMGPIRGGLAMSVVIIGAIMGAMVGLVGAAIFTIGIVAIPAMQKRGYHKHMIMGPLMAGSALAQLIPPSTLMLVYGAIGEVSVGKMFIGGIFPGILMASLYVAFVAVRIGLKPELGPPIAVEERGTWGQKFRSLNTVILPVFIILGVIGSIFFGVATPTEAASVGVVGALISAAINRRLTWPVVQDSLISTIRLVGMIFWILIGAYVFTRFYIVMGASTMIEEAILGMGVSPWMVLIAMQVSLIFMGMVMEDIAIIMIAAPIYAPIATSLGFDPLWFAVIFMINLQISQLTPPYGFALFYGKTLMPDEPMSMLWRSAGPFVPLQIIGLAICMRFPQIILWLPGLMFQRRF